MNSNSKHTPFSLMALVLLFGFLSGTVTYGQETLKVMTYNIRFDHPGDGKDQWKKRRKALVKQFKDESPDFCGTQEGLLHQVEELKSELNNYTYIGVGRDDGNSEGEFSALFFDSTRWALISGETFWLSETPSVPSLGWDANCRRVVTWGKFRNHLGDNIIVMNTHLDHMGEEARKNSIRLIKDRINAMGDESVILTGDFNFTPDDPNYKVITSFLADARQTADRVQEAHPGTYNGFSITGDFERRIDYVFVSSQGFHVNRYNVPDWRRKGNRQISDHFPVIVELTIMEP